jgi:hypothetical protein
MPPRPDMPARPRPIKLPPRPGARLLSVWRGKDVGADFTPAEEEFFKAVDRYRTKYRRQFPTLGELFSVFMALGYTRPEPGRRGAVG